MTMKKLNIAIVDMIGEGWSEEEICANLIMMWETGQISREQYIYGLGSVNLYFRKEDE